MGGPRTWSVVWCACAALLAAERRGAARLAPLAAPARYAADTSVLLGAAAPGDVGYRLRSELAVNPVWADDSHILLHFTLESPQLLLRGKHQNAEFEPRPSLWDSRPRSSFAAVWSAGHITHAYLDPQDPPDVLNYKKALISLFQFQLEEGERNETDVSGQCLARYERAADLVFRKFKHSCSWEDTAEGWGGWEPWEEAGVRRATRLQLSADGAALALVSADELLLAAGLKARARTDLTLLPAAGAPPTPPPPAADLGEALLLHAAARLRHGLAMDIHEHDADESELESLESAVRSRRAALAGEAAGSAEAAEATLTLLPVLRRASADALLNLLQHPDSEPILEGLSLALGLAGAAGTHAAAREALQLAARPPPRPGPARAYWAALAHAPRVAAPVLRDALALGTAPALLAAAAAARAQPPLQPEVRQKLLKGLARCKESECRAEHLLALAQLRRADGVEVLLTHAEGGARREALAALAGLALLPGAALAPARARLQRLALGLAAPLPLEARAAALELALAAGARFPAALVSLTAALRARGPRELRRVCALRLRALAAEPRHAELRRLLPALDPRPADWLRRAYEGTSSVLTYSRGWLRLDSSQLASAGVLRRGAVSLSPPALPHLLTIEMWTRGLESFSSSEPPPPPGAREPEDEPAPAGEEGEEEAVEGGLALTVGGAREPDIVLFSGQGELLGHIWAGTGSEPTPLLRAVLPRAPRRAAVPLQAGAALRLRAGAAVALAQHAHAQVSLWGRTARAGTLLRGAGSHSLSLALRTAWGHAAAHARAQLAPALDISASLDFYDKPQLCVATDLLEYHLERNVTLESSLGARRWRVRRVRVSRSAQPGVTLALGARNDAACRALGAAHQH